MTKPTIAEIVLTIHVIIGGIVVFVGLDLKKWHSWLVGLYAFVVGFLFALSIWSSLSGALQLGALFAFAILYGGATTHWHRRRLK